MSARITQNMVARSMLSDLGAASTRLSQTQRKLASGKELTRPSDDPFATTHALGLRADLDAVRQHQRNADDATAWTEASDTAMGDLASIIHRARELVLAGASDTAAPESRRAAAQEVRGLLDAAKQAGNANLGGRYLFGGAQTTAPPFRAADDLYAGDTTAMAREIGRGVALPVNVTGDRLLGPAPGGSGLLGALREAAAHLAGATPADLAALRGGDLRALDGALDGVSSLRTEVGVTAGRLEAARGRLDDLELSAQGLLSETEDADMAKTMVDFSMQQSVYGSALKAGANIVQASLLDFLR